MHWYCCLLALFSGRHCECSGLPLLINHSLAIVVLLTLAHVLKVALHANHVIMGHPIEIFASSLVFLSQRVILGEVFLLVPIDVADSFKLSILLLLQN